MHCLYQWRGRHPDHLEQALSASARALALRPDLAEAHSARGYALALGGQTAEAEREFRTAIEMNPRLYEAHYSTRARAWSRAGSRTRLALFERAAEVSPEDDQSRSLLAPVLRGLGQYERARREGEEATLVATRSLERNPDDVRALYMIGIELIRLDETARGLEYLERALEKDPSDGGTLYNVACGYALAGRTEQALDVLEKAIDKAITNLDWIANDPDWAGLRDHRLR